MVATTVCQTNCCSVGSIPIRVRFFRIKMKDCMNEITNEERAARNRKIAEACGWPVWGVDLTAGCVEIAKANGTTREYDATRSLDDCAMAEEKLGVLPVITWNQYEDDGQGNPWWECDCEYIDKKCVPVFFRWKNKVALTEPLVRSAALEGVCNGG